MRMPLKVRSLLGRKSALVVVGGVAVLGLSATAAFAYWTTTGSGTGSAATGNSTPVVISQTGTTANLVPGGPAQAVSFKIHNPATGPQYVGSVTMAVTSGWSAQADTNKPACTAADFTLVQPTAINQDLAVNDTAFSSSGASVALNDAATNQDNCKNVTVPLTFTSN